MSRDQGITVRSPFDGSVVGTAPAGTPADVTAAVARARAASESFRRTTVGDRKALLYRLAAAIAEDAEAMARTIALEMGKTIREARNEVRRAQNTLRLSGDAATFLDGEVINGGVLEGAPDKTAYVTYEAAGVVGAITPFNYPLNLLCHKLGPAIGAGNTVVAKPATKAPLAALRLQDLARSCGWPAELFQVVCGAGGEIASALACADIDILSLTGGTEAGLALHRAAGLKRCLMELGGNDPLIVMPDADLDAAADTAVRHRFEIAGQSCAAVKRLYLHADIKRAVLERILARVAALRTGDPLDESTDMGPVISEGAAAEVLRRVDDAVAAGAKLLAGGTRKGTMVVPTVLDQVPADAEIVREETFGPVLSVRPFTDPGSVITEVNAGRYGLQAGVYTNDHRLVMRFGRELRVGGVMVNEGPDFRLEHVPFGGVKASGLGREGVRIAIREMSESKVVVM